MSTLRQANKNLDTRLSYSRVKKSQANLGYLVNGRAWTTLHCY